MRLFEEIMAQLDADSGDGGGALYVVAEGRGGYFENVKDLGAFSSQEVCLIVKKGKLRVCGKNLRVDKYREGDVLLHGEILSVAREEN